ncbi:hypothetical protein [Hydrogenophaga sp.]
MGARPVHTISSGDLGGVAQPSVAALGRRLPLVAAVLKRRGHGIPSRNNDFRKAAMRSMAMLFFTALLWPLSAIACPIGMQFNGNGCSPPYEYTGWDLMRDRRAAIEAIGSNPIHKRSYENTSSPEEIRKRRELEQQVKKEKEEKEQALEKGVWQVDSKPTPEGHLCAAVFSKYTNSQRDGVIGGLITVMGFQQPKQDAWLIFQGTKLPKPNGVRKMQITLQQDNEPAQTLQVFNYRETRDVGTIMFAVPGLAAMLNGMNDKQRFRLSDNGEVLLDVEWHSAAPVIAKLKQCES